MRGRQGRVRTQKRKKKNNAEKRVSKKRRDAPSLLVREQALTSPRNLIRTWREGLLNQFSAKRITRSFGRSWASPGASSRTLFHNSKHPFTSQRKTKRSLLAALRPTKEVDPAPLSSPAHPAPKVSHEAVQVDVKRPLQMQVAPPEPPHVLVQSPEPPPHFSQTSLRIRDLIRPDPRLQQSIEAFLLDQRSEHTRRAYGKDLKRFIQFLHLREAERGPERLERSVVIGFKESLLREKLEHTTVDRHLASLRSFFKWLVDDGVLEKNPAEGVRFLKPKRLSTTVGFSDAEVIKVLAQPDLHTRTGAMHYAILMVLFYCGLRRSELCSLKMTSLGEERGHRVIRLRGKGNSERVIPLIPPVWNALRYYFRISGRRPLGEGYLFTAIRRGNPSIKPPSPGLKALNPSMIFYIVTKYARAAGVANRVSPHSCRATAISHARDRQVPDRAIQEFAGWASPDMITRYDKRKTSVEKSASLAIRYGADDRPLPPLETSLSLSGEEPLLSRAVLSSSEEKL
jgi:integrase/recombinase XerD